VLFSGIGGIQGAGFSLAEDLLSRFGSLFSLEVSGRLALGLNRPPRLSLHSRQALLLVDG
jgi:hypothetical protein